MEISSNIVRERQKYVKSMMQFIEEKKQRLNKVLEKLGLSEEGLLKKEEKKICPYNKDHIVPTNSFKKHVASCNLLSAGYQKDELPAQLQDVDFCYENTEAIMKIEIDENSLNKIIWDHSVENGQVYTGHRSMPNSSIDENIMLTQEDRFAIYKHVVKKSHEAGKVILVDRSDELLTTDWGSLVKKGLLDEQNNKQFSSKLEQLAALRDLKRRRQSYRAKNVHITKKSYTEIIREVISNQMEILVPGYSSDVASAVQVETTDTRSESRENSRRESKDRDRQRDLSTGEKEMRRRDYGGEYDKRRSRDVERGFSREENRHRNESDERYSNWTGRDSWYSKEWVSGGLLSKVHEENSSSIAKPRRFTETDDVLLKEIKKEPLMNDAESSIENMSACGAGCEIMKEELEIIDGNHTKKSDESHKRKRSDSDSSSQKNGGRHKKSKHKKKHKKHKRRD